MGVSFSSAKRLNAILAVSPLLTRAAGTGTSATRNGGPHGLGLDVAERHRTEELRGQNQTRPEAEPRGITLWGFDWALSGTLSTPSRVSFSLF